MSERDESTATKSGVHDWAYNARVAVGVAVSATVLSIFNVIDGNVVQDMWDARAHWLSNSVSHTVEETRLTALSIEKSNAERDREQRKRRNERLRQSGQVDPTGEKERAAEIARREQDIRDLDEDVHTLERQHESVTRERDRIRADAEANESTYRRLGHKDDLLDIAEATLAAAIACFGVSAVVRSLGLALVAVVFSLMGTIVGVAGALDLSIPVDGFLVPLAASMAGAALGVLLTRGPVRASRLRSLLAMRGSGSDGLARSEDPRP